MWARCQHRVLKYSRAVWKRRVYSERSKQNWTYAKFAEASPRTVYDNKSDDKNYRDYLNEPAVRTLSAYYISQLTPSFLSSKKLSSRQLKNRFCREFEQNGTAVSVNEKYVSFIFLFVLFSVFTVNRPLFFLFAAYLYRLRQLTITLFSLCAGELDYEKVRVCIYIYIRIYALIKNQK